MKFISSIEDKAKDTILLSIANLLEKNPKNNLPKIIKMSKLLVSDKLSSNMIKNFESSYNEFPDFKSYFDDFIINTDYKILKNLIVNILGNNIRSKKKSHSLLSGNSNNPHSLIINSNGNNLSSKVLNYNNIDNIVFESRKIGIFAFIINAPGIFSLNYLYDIYEKYADSLFIPITDGNNINDSICKKILNCSNVIPMLPYNNNSNILRQNRIPSLNINYIHSLFEKSKFNNDLYKLKTFSLDFNNFSKNKMIMYSLSDLIKNKNI